MSSSCVPTLPSDALESMLVGWGRPSKCCGMGGREARIWEQMLYVMMGKAPALAKQDLVSHQHLSPLCSADLQECLS